MSLVEGARRASGWIVLCMALIGPGKPPARADLAGALSEAYSEYQAGRILRAAALLGAELDGTNPSDLTTRATIASGMVELCRRSGDYGCLAKAGRELERVAGIQIGRGERDVPSIVWGAIAQSYFLEWDDPYFRQIITGLETLIPAERFWHLFIPAQLRAARLHLELGEIVEARMAAGRALALVASRSGNQQFEAAWLLEAINLIAMSGDMSRALRLLSEAYRFLSVMLPATSLEYQRFRALEGGLLTRAGLAGQAPGRNALLEAIDRLECLELGEFGRAFDRRNLETDLLGSLAYSEELRGLNARLRDSEADQVPERLLWDGKFSSPTELAAAVASSLDRVASKREIPASWKAAFEEGPDRLAAMVQEQDAAAIGGLVHAGRGLVAVAEGLPPTAQYLELARIQVSEMDRVWRDRFDAFYQPTPLEQLLAQIGLGLGAVPNALEGRNIDEALGLIEMLNRDFSHEAADALALRAELASEDAEELGREFLRVTSQRNRAELSAVRELVTGSRIDSKRPGVEFGIDLDSWIVLSDLGSRSEDLLETFKRSRPAVRRVPTKDQVQNVLREDEVLLASTFALGQLVQLAIGKERVEVGLVKVTPELSIDMRLLDAALKATHNPSAVLDAQYPVAAAERLGRSLFGLIEERFPEARRIVWAGPTYFEGLSLGALLMSAPARRGSGYDLGAGDWVANRWAISRTISTRAFLSAARLAEAEAAFSPGFLGIGDPVITGAETGPIAESAEREQGSRLRGWRGAAALEELPDAGEELRQSATSFGTGARVLLREKATESETRRLLLESWAVLSFATHGLLRGELPGLTEAALLLSPDADAADPARDGVLTASEIAEAGPRAGLAVLSACNTGAVDGNLFGVGVQGLSMAFAMSGVPATLTSLWSVESKTTARLMTATLRAVASGEDVSMALQGAIRSHLREPGAVEFTHPRFWAPFSVYGRSKARPALANSEVAPVEVDWLDQWYENDGGSRAVRWDRRSGALTYGLAASGTSDAPEVGGEAPPLSTGNKCPAALGSIVRMVSVAEGNVQVSEKRRSAGEWETLIAFSRHDQRPGWCVQLSEGAFGSRPLALAASQGRVVVLTGGDSEWPYPDRGAACIKLHEFGMDGKRRLEMPLEWRQGLMAAQAGVALVEERAIVILGDQGGEESDSSTRNRFGALRSCRFGALSEVQAIDLRKRRVDARNVLMGVYLGSVVADASGRLIVGGSERKGCWETEEAFLGELRPDLSVRPFYVDQTGLKTQIDRVVSLEEGEATVVGHAWESLRWVSPGEPASQRGSTSTGPGSAGDDVRRWRQAFVMAVRPDGSTERRTWLRSGWPVFVYDATSTPSGVAVRGATGGKPFVAYVRRTDASPD